jgi:hypothetical protein
MVADYEASGLTREAFCNQRDVGLKTLDRYVTRYRKQRAADGTEPQRWVAVEVATHSGCGSEMTVLLSTGRRIEIKRGFDAGALRQLVAVLEQV